MNHELVWLQVPRGTARATPWGWQAGCTCGWAQDVSAGVGTQKQGRRAYYKHKEALH